MCIYTHKIIYVLCFGDVLCAKKNYKQFEYKWNIEDAVGWQMSNLAEIFIFYDF